MGEALTDAPEAAQERAKLDPVRLIEELNAAADGVRQASTKLYRLTVEYDNVVDEETGEVSLGVGARYEIALEGHLVAIAEEHAPKRPPGEDVREAMAKARLRAADPELDADHRRLTTEIKALQKWISQRRDVISAKQTVLNGIQRAGA